MQRLERRGTTFGTKRSNVWNEEEQRLERRENTHDNFSYSYQEHQGHFTSTNQSNQGLADSPTQESQLTDMSSIYENLFSESNDITLTYNRNLSISL